MATLQGRTTSQPQDPDQNVVAVVDAAELEAAKREPGVRALLRDADAYLADLERRGRIVAV
ncbi:MAG TPA: hypothetical protein VHW26_09995 [Solirubrobacteraceae bacterium]|nr:hypothetical protein [Solirubrobacteraceae bacterium]